MNDDSSNNDGFVVRSRPDAGIVVETRPLTPKEMRSLDVGDFFARNPSTVRMLGAMLNHHLTPAQVTVLTTPRPTPWRAVWDCALLVALGASMAVLDLALLPWGYGAAAYLGVAATLCATPAALWRRRVQAWEADRERVRRELAA